MLAASHAIAGAIIASKAATPEIGVGLALLSHPLLDLFPHWDFSTRSTKKRKLKIIIISLADAFVGFAIGLLAFAGQVDWKILMITMLAAQLPDWLEAPLHVFEWRFPPFSTIKKAQHFWHTKMDWPWGFLPQLALAIAGFFI